MVNIGRYKTLDIVRQVEHGVYLADDQTEEILLPNAYVPQDYNIGDKIDVFLYRDSEDRIIATTQRPFATVGEFAALKVVATTAVGAFLDWGLQKDLLVPFQEQQTRMKTEQKHLVYIYLDEETDRIVATSRFNRFLSDDTRELIDGEEVDLTIHKQTPLGFSAIINNRYKGILYENEIFQVLSVGDKVKGYIKQVRPDGKVDLILQKTGLQHIDPVSEKIIQFLQDNDGKITITDKSPAELIYATFGVSKRSFKQAIGKLYKKRLITIEKDQINLVK